ncbi:LysR family transcriptional regulator [Microbulbifer sp. A4B17]|uniref:LysR family transcriptional regulator n=1 Tax=Microbulbifer sp. A4B17 TaxID=359370 RepID=UPI001300A4E4|nr:LysR family transcriptional regulator [Microbulbifer sp. A4B17]
MRKLPFANLLVTFDAAARHLSFKEAAEELFITPSAVGHQVRALEKEHQTKLFVRLNRYLELTTIGKQYHRKIAGALQSLRRVTSELLDRS